MLLKRQYWHTILKYFSDIKYYVCYPYSFKQLFSVLNTKSFLIIRELFCVLFNIKFKDDFN